MDESNFVWIMLHSGSRGVGNKIGSYFIELAKRDMKNHFFNIPDKDLAYFKEGSKHFEDYVQGNLENDLEIPWKFSHVAVEWAQKYARLNRACMMDNVLEAIRSTKLLPEFTTGEIAVNCHHN